MKTPLLLILFLSCSLLSTAQVGIGTQSPDPSSILDINGS
jgi:hypothetical protein